MLGYVYAHRKASNGTIFYIGIGGFAKSEKPGSFKRAFKLTQRNVHHMRIVAKYGVRVEIIATNLTLDAAKNLEKEQIKINDLYKLGANRTLGGDGTVGYKHSATNKIKTGLATIARFNNPAWRQTWRKRFEARDVKGALDKLLNTYGVKSFNVYQVKLISSPGKGSGVKTYEKVKFMGTWKCKAKCCRDLGIQCEPSKIRECLSNKRNMAYGFAFEYAES